MTDSQHTQDWLVLSGLPGVGPRTIALLLQRFGTPRQVLSAGRAALREAGLGQDAIDAALHPDEAAVAAALAWSEQPGASILTCDDPRYPPLLAALDAAPPVLFVRGRVDLLAEPQLAIVGSRNPTPGGIEAAHDYARYLGGLGLTVTSGLAIGIDAAAHQGALCSGCTIAVLGTGPDRVYPAANRALARRIADEGALVTEFPPGTGPQASHFPRRNRVISGLSLGTLVVEAAPKSGSLITARFAAEQGREVFAMPGSIHNPLARGCHGLIRQGAKLVDSADQILEELSPQLRRFTQAQPPAPDRARSGAEAGAGAGAGAAASRPAAADGLDPDYARLLASMGYDPRAPDELIARSGLSAQAVSSMLLLLELQGLVSAHAGGRYSLRGG
ncbi:DNA-processing protein DprA [Thiohalocapsa marina]|uniref:DNA-processing protein DprA n=1 Tax=Thiohalocapsa marina TaxID=424902 RepID=UPI0036D932D9